MRFCFCWLLLFLCFIVFVFVVGEDEEMCFAVCLLCLGGLGWTVDEPLALRFLRVFFIFIFFLRTMKEIY